MKQVGHKLSGMEYARYMHSHKPLQTML